MSQKFDRTYGAVCVLLCGGLLGLINVADAAVPNLIPDMIQDMSNAFAGNITGLYDGQ